MPSITEIMAGARRQTQAFEQQARAGLGRRKAAPSAVPLESIASAGPPSLFGAAGDKRRRFDDAYRHFRHWNYVCISAIARRLAGQPFMAGFNPEASAEGNERGVPYTRKATPADRVKMPTRLKEAPYAQAFEMLMEHPVLDALNRPNSVQRRFEFLFTFAANLLLAGESYIVGGLAKGQDGERLEMWAIPRNWITPKHEGRLFSGYELRLREGGKGIPLAPEQVARVYIPDPADPKSCISPVATQFAAVRTDDYIQSSQEESFRRGIFPNVAIRVGQRIGDDGKPTGARPTLTAAQRRQIVRAVNTVWRSTAGAGDPAILDGMIEEVFRLDRSGREMDWIKSGEAVKARIFQAFGVNPYIVGEITNANRAQAVVAERSFCDGAVNPLADALSEALTDFVRPHYSDVPRLCVWLQPCRPTDEELDLQRWTLALNSGAVDPSEYRAEVMGLPPLEEDDAGLVLDDPGDDEEEEQFRSLKSPQQRTLRRRALLQAGHLKQVDALSAGVADAMQAFFREADSPDRLRLPPPVASGQ